MPPTPTTVLSEPQSANGALGEGVGRSSGGDEWGNDPLIGVTLDDVVPLTDTIAGNPTWAILTVEWEEAGYVDLRPLIVGDFTNLSGIPDEAEIVAVRLNTHIGLSNQTFVPVVQLVPDQITLFNDADDSTWLNGAIGRFLGDPTTVVGGGLEASLVNDLVFGAPITAAQLKSANFKLGSQFSAVAESAPENIIVRTRGFQLEIDWLYPRALWFFLFPSSGVAAPSLFGTIEDDVGYISLPIEVTYDSAEYMLAAAWIRQDQRDTVLATFANPSGWTNSVDDAKAVLRSNDLMSWWWLFDSFAARKGAR